jgi:hypothetical protein
LLGFILIAKLFRFLKFLVVIYFRFSLSSAGQCGNLIIFLGIEITPACSMMIDIKPGRLENPHNYRIMDLQMAKRPSLTKIVAEAAFYYAWSTNTPEVNLDPETYQPIFMRYLKRFEMMPALTLRTVAKAASAEANRSIKAYEKLRPTREILLYCLI